MVKKCIQMKFIFHAFFSQSLMRKTESYVCFWKKLVEISALTRTRDAQNLLC